MVPLCPVLPGIQVNVAEGMTQKSLGPSSEQAATTVQTLDALGILTRTLCVPAVASVAAIPLVRPIAGGLLAIYFPILSTSHNVWQAKGLNTQPLKL